MKKLLVLLLFPLLSMQAPGQSATFSKYLSNAPANTSFRVARALSSQAGYLLLAERYTTLRSTFLVRTDTALQPVWTRRISFPQAPAPFDNTVFYDAGELPSGNYYLFGAAADPSAQVTWYVVMVLDTNGQVLHHTALRETSHAANISNTPRMRVGADGSLVLATSEYEWLGYYRLDTALNLLSSGFYELQQNIASRGNDVLMLADSSLLLTGEYGGGSYTLTKISPQGSMLWSRGNTFPGRIFTLYEAPDKSIYAGGAGNYPFLSHLDSAGNVLWIREYSSPSTMLQNSAVYCIYPVSGGRLMLYNDSVTFEVDTLGNPFNPGYAQPKYNYGELRPAGADFTYCAIIYQPVPGQYMPTIMRFPTPGASSCMEPRSVVAAAAAGTSFYPPTVVKNGNVLQQSPPYVDTLLTFSYDAMPACPPGPNGIAEQTLHALTIFPNPANGILHFRCPMPLATLVITDATGRCVRTEKMEGEAFSISTADLAEGLYAVHVLANGAWIAAGKFCVIH